VRPKTDEHAPYYSRYIERVPNGNLLEVLRDQSMDTVALLRDVSPERANYAYAPGKWTVKEVVGHVIDAERVFAYRALRFGRNDPTELAGFEQDPYVPAGNFGDRTLGDLLEELQVVRAATIHLARHANDEVLSRRGVASGKEVSVRALFYIIAGHERHHVELLRERYLQG
jgi:hypothetical protein